MPQASGLYRLSARYLILSFLQNPTPQRALPSLVILSALGRINRKTLPLPYIPPSPEDQWMSHERHKSNE